MHEPAKIRAAVRLLTDREPAVVRRCRRFLIQEGEAARAELERAGRESDPQVRLVARSVLASIDLRKWTREVCALGDSVSAGRRGTELLENGVVLIGSFGRSAGLTRAELEVELEGMAAAVRPLVEHRTSVTAARNLAGHLGGVLGFQGCASSYYRPENLFLDRVLERRRGLPVALVALYLMVARRAGMRVTAVKLPEYFLVRVHGARRILLDPFHGGRSVTKADCLRYLRESGCGLASSSQLRDVDDIHVLLGMMSTLARVYEHREDREFREALQRAQRSLSWL
jgi:hypothetical protein